MPCVVRPHQDLSKCVQSEQKSWALLVHLMNFHARYHTIIPPHSFTVLDSFFIVGVRATMFMSEVSAIADCPQTATTPALSTPLMINSVNQVFFAFSLLRVSKHNVSCRVHLVWESREAYQYPLETVII